MSTSTLERLNPQFNTVECNWCSLPGARVRPGHAGERQGLSQGRVVGAPAAPAPLGSPRAAEPCSALPRHRFLHPPSPTPSQRLSTVVDSAWHGFTLWCQFWPCVFLLGEGIWHSSYLPFAMPMDELGHLGKVTGFSLGILESVFCVGVEAASLLQGWC